VAADENKSTHVSFTLNQEDCPAVILNGKHIPKDETARYLGIHLGSRLTWKTHIFIKRKQLGLMFECLYRILGRNSDLSLANKLLLYKTILEPLWKYGLLLWGSACHSNIEILEIFQNKVLRKIANAPWYTPDFYTLIYRCQPFGKK
jgi:hypothetical protein